MEHVHLVRRDTAYWELAQRHPPTHAESLVRYATAIGGLDEQLALDRAYADMQPANFSRDVFSQARELAVTRVDGTGWSDWGSPHRVFASLQGTPALDRLLQRIREPFAFANLAAPYLKQDRVTDRNCSRLYVSDRELHPSQ